MVNIEDIESFKSISGCDDEPLIIRYLEMFPGNINNAINEYFSDIGNESSVNGANHIAENNGQFGSCGQDDDVRTPIPSFNDQLIQDYHQDTANSISHYSIYNRPNLDSDSFSLTEDFSTQMFTPPVSIMFNESFEIAREKAKSARKLLLVNIQNPTEFSSMILNRDIWNDTLIIEFIKEHFIFWQRSSNTPQGIEWINIYNITKLPHVSVVDPRTGRQVKVWDVAKSFSDSITASSEIIEFLEADNTIKTIDRMNTDEQHSLINANFNATSSESSSSCTIESSNKSNSDSNAASSAPQENSSEIQIPKINSQLAMLHMERMKRKNSEKK